MVRNRIPKEFASIFVTRNGIPSCFLFRGMVQNRITRVGFYFCSLVQNSKPFSPLQNGSERNSESFLFRGTAGIPPEQTNCSIYSVFRGKFFVRNCQPYGTMSNRKQPSRLDFWVVFWIVYFFASNSLRRSEKETFVGYLERAAVQINPEK